MPVIYISQSLYQLPFIYDFVVKNPAITNKSFTAFAPPRCPFIIYPGNSLWSMRPKMLSIAIPFKKEIHFISALLWLISYFSLFRNGNLITFENATHNTIVKLILHISYMLLHAIDIPIFSMAVSHSENKNQ